MSTPTLTVALDLGGYISGAQLDDATNAQLDSAVLGPITPTFSQDITPYVREASTHRGANRELERVEAGTGSVALDNRDGRFTPFNSASPYYPYILPMRRIRISGTWPRFIALNNLGASDNPDAEGSGTSLSNTSWGPPTSGLIVLFVLNNFVGTPNVPTVSGNGITWVQIATVLGTANTRMTLFGADASGASVGATTADFAGQSQANVKMAFMHADGVDLGGGVAGAFVQAPTGFGTAQTSASITLSAAGNSANRPIAAFAVGNVPMTPRTNWIEFDTLTAGSASYHKLKTQERPDAFETTASATWDGAARDWEGIAAELKSDNAITYPVLTGFVEEWPVAFPGDKDMETRVSLVDGMKMLSLANVSGSFSQQGSGARINAILDAVNWPNTIDVTPITFDNLGATSNPDAWASSGTSLTNSSWTPPTSGLIILYVVSVLATAPNIPTVTGNNLTWVNIATIVNSGASRRMTLFGAKASGSTTGTTTVDFGGQSQTSIHMAFMHADGVDLSTGVPAAFVQAPTVDATATSGSITLAAPANTNNRPISAWTINVQGITPRASWTEADETPLTGIRILETQYRSDAFETTASATWDGVSRGYLGIAAELKVLVESHDRDIDVGTATVPAITLDNVSALEHIQQIAHAEGGRFFIGKDGKAVFRQDVETNPDISTRIWADDGTGMSYREIVPTLSDDLILNDVHLTRAGGVEQVATDEASKTQYGIRSSSETDIQLVSDAAVLDRATAQIGRYAQPVLRLESLVDNAMQHDLWDRVLVRDINDITKVIESQTATSQISSIEGLSHDIGRDGSWTVTLAVAPSSLIVAGVLDDPVYGLLDSTAILR
jgi:hypothetical protein